MQTRKNFHGSNQ